MLTSIRVNPLPIQRRGRYRKFFLTFVPVTAAAPASHPLLPCPAEEEEEHKKYIIVKEKPKKEEHHKKVVIKEEEEEKKEKEHKKVVVVEHKPKKEEDKKVVVHKKEEKKEEKKHGKFSIALCWKCTASLQVNSRDLVPLAPFVVSVLAMRTVASVSLLHNACDTNYSMRQGCNLTQRAV